jgi:hypothetical protein
LLVLVENRESVGMATVRATVKVVLRATWPSMSKSARYGPRG